MPLPFLLTGSDRTVFPWHFLCGSASQDSRFGVRTPQRCLLAQCVEYNGFCSRCYWVSSVVSGEGGSSVSFRSFLIKCFTLDSNCLHVPLPRCRRHTVLISSYFRQLLQPSAIIACCHFERRGSRQGCWRLHGAAAWSAVTMTTGGRHATRT